LKRLSGKDEVIPEFSIGNSAVKFETVSLTCVIITYNRDMSQSKFNMNIRNHQPPGKMLATIPVASAYCIHAFNILRINELKKLRSLKQRYESLIMATFV